VRLGAQYNWFNHPCAWEHSTIGSTIRALGSTVQLVQPNWNSSANGTAAPMEQGNGRARWHPTDIAIKMKSSRFPNTKKQRKSCQLDKTLTQAKSTLRLKHKPIKLQDSNQQ
jgi:hypothetical protein